VRASLICDYFSCSIYPLMAEIKPDTRPAGPSVLIIAEMRQAKAQHPMSVEVTAIAPMPTLLISTPALSRAAFLSLVIVVSFIGISCYRVLK